MHSMLDVDARALLRRSRFGILSLTHEGDAYGLPLFYAYDGRAVYFHTLPGAKLRYVASTREACLVVCVVEDADEWASVQVFGALQRIDGTPDTLRAMDALKSLPLPPEFGFTAQGEPKRAEAAPIYRLNVTRISGRFSERHPMVRAASDADVA